MLAHGFYHFKLKRNAPIACTPFEPKLGLHRNAIKAIAPPVTPSGIALCDRDQFGGPPEIPAHRLVDEAVTVGVASVDADVAVSTLDASNAVAARSVIARDGWGRIGAGVRAVVGPGV
jgi:hypothetical protein